MRYKAASEIKDMARERLQGRYGAPIGAFVVTALISTAASMGSGIFYRSDSVAGVLIYSLISIILSLLIGVLSLGLVKFYLNFTRSDKYQISDVFWAFQNHPDRAIIVTALLALMAVGLLLPSIIFFTICILTGSMISFLLGLFTMLGGLILFIIIALRFSLVYCILADAPETPAIEALRESSRMMKGHKGRLFYLQLTFVGWYLLSMLTCGIGLLWIEPYMQVSMVYFYMELKGELHEQVIDVHV